MNISFFQTYGDRLPLLKIRSEDNCFQNFINNFDINIISLHNVSDNVREYIKNTKILKNSLIFDFKNINYCQCIQHLMTFLEEKKADKFFFYQDDTFSCEINNKNIEELKKLIFENNFDLINISYKLEHLIEKGKWTAEEKKIIYNTPYFNLFDTTTFDFKNSGLWAYDDSCFICSFNKLKTIYDNKYFSFSDVWQAENYLRQKFEQENMNRFITDISFFINYNILGHNTNSINIEKLKNNISISENSLKLLIKYYRGNYDPQ